MSDPLSALPQVPPEARIGPWIALVIGGIGLALMVVAAFAVAKRLRMGNNWIHATGLVVGYREIETSTRSEDEPGGVNRAGRVSRTASYPIIEFVDSAGAKHRFTSKLGTTDGTAERLPIIYPAAAPAQAEVQHGFAQTGWIVVVAGLALGLCATAWFVRNRL